ncbi:hypothetical protein LMG19145_01510 [Xanthomonas arboricola pv. fragariae]|nr:hypothetical protein LMG19145_01510 [Xanthomonas arboricola pv. fragariae]
MDVRCRCPGTGASDARNDGRWPRHRSAPRRPLALLSRGVALALLCRVAGAALHRLAGADRCGIPVPGGDRPQRAPWVEGGAGGRAAGVCATPGRCGAAQIRRQLVSLHHAHTRRCQCRDRAGRHARCAAGGVCRPVSRTRARRAARARHPGLDDSPAAQSRVDRAVCARLDRNGGGLGDRAGADRCVSVVAARAPRRGGQRARHAGAAAVLARSACGHRCRRRCSVAVPGADRDAVVVAVGRAGQSLGQRAGLRVSGRCAGAAADVATAFVRDDRSGVVVAAGAGAGVYGAWAGNRGGG